MSWQLVFLWSRKIHRLAMWLVLLFGSAMMLGGLVMHQEIKGEWYPEFINSSVMRDLHVTLAIPFTVVLIVMMATGVLMWAIPKIIQSRNANKPQTPK